MSNGGGPKSVSQVSRRLEKEMENGQPWEEPGRDLEEDRAASRFSWTLAIREDGKREETSTDSASRPAGGSGLAKMGQVSAHE